MSPRHEPYIPPKLPTMADIRIKKQFEEFVERKLIMNMVPVNKPTIKEFENGNFLIEMPKYIPDPPTNWIQIEAAISKSIMEVLPPLPERVKQSIAIEVIEKFKFNMGIDK